MNAQTNQPQINITPEIVATAADAGITLLNLDSTLVPGSLRKQLAVLELILRNLVTGNLVVAPPAQDAVESDSEAAGAASPIDETAVAAKLAAAGADAKPVGAANDVTDIGAGQDGGPSGESQ